jgi:hypothetical protein
MVVMQYNSKVHNCSISTSPILLCVMVVVRVTDLLLYNIQTSNNRLELLYRMDEKCTAKPTECESTPQYKGKIVYERSPSEAWFPCYALLNIKENVQSVHLKCPCRPCNRQTFGTILSFITSECGCLP